MQQIHTFIMNIAIIMTITMVNITMNGFIFIVLNTFILLLFPFICVTVIYYTIIPIKFLGDRMSLSRPRRLSVSAHMEISRLNMMKKTTTNQMATLQLPQSKRVEEVKKNMNKLQASMKQFEYDEVLQPLAISFKNMYMRLKSNGKMKIVIFKIYFINSIIIIDPILILLHIIFFTILIIICCFIFVNTTIVVIITINIIIILIGCVLLRNICANISPCLVTAIMGPSGAGKNMTVWLQD